MLPLVVSLALALQPGRTLPTRVGRGGSVLMNGAGPYPSGSYDPKAARDYYTSRPFSVAGRAVELVLQSTGFGLSLLADYAGG